MEDAGGTIIPFFSGLTIQNRKEMIRMVPIFVILTIVGCIGIKSLSQRIRRTHSAEEISMRRVKWGLTEEAFLKS
jgi:hypothetical protein